MNTGPEPLQVKQNKLWVCNEQKCFSHKLHESKGRNKVFLWNLYAGVSKYFEVGVSNRKSRQLWQVRLFAARRLLSDIFNQVAGGTPALTSSFWKPCSKSVLHSWNHFVQLILYTKLKALIAHILFQNRFLGAHPWGAWNEGVSYFFLTEKGDINSQTSSQALFLYFTN